MVYIKSLDEFKELLEKSKEVPVVLYKHSSRCSVSFSAMDEMTGFMEKYPSAHVRGVLVVEDRPVSLGIADMMDVVHKSPQILIIKDGQVVSNESHFNITKSKVKSMLEEVNY